MKLCRRRKLTHCVHCVRIIYLPYASTAWIQNIDKVRYVAILMWNQFKFFSESMCALVNHIFCIQNSHQHKTDGAKSWETMSEHVRGNDNDVYTTFSCQFDDFFFYFFFHFWFPLLLQCTWTCFSAIDSFVCLCRSLFLSVTHNHTTLACERYSCVVELARTIILSPTI